MSSNRLPTRISSNRTPPHGYHYPSESQRSLSIMMSVELDKEVESNGNSKSHAVYSGSDVNSYSYVNPVPDVHRAASPSGSSSASSSGSSSRSSSASTSACTSASTSGSNKVAFEFEAQQVQQRIRVVEETAASYPISAAKVLEATSGASSYYPRRRILVDPRLDPSLLAQTRTLRIDEQDMVDRPIGRVPVLPEILRVNDNDDDNESGSGYKNLNDKGKNVERVVRDVDEVSVGDSNSSGFSFGSQKQRQRHLAGPGLSVFGSVPASEAELMPPYTARRPTPPSNTGAHRGLTGYHSPSSSDHVPLPTPSLSLTGSHTTSTIRSTTSQSRGRPEATSTSTGLAPEPEAPMIMTPAISVLPGHIPAFKGFQHKYTSTPAIVPPRPASVFMRTSSSSSVPVPTPTSRAHSNSTNATFVPLLPPSSSSSISITQRSSLRTSAAQAPSPSRTESRRPSLPAVNVMPLTSPDGFANKLDTRNARSESAIDVDGDIEPDEAWKANLRQSIQLRVTKMKAQKRASHATFMKGIINEEDRRRFEWEYEQSLSRPQQKFDVESWAEYQFGSQLQRERERRVRMREQSRRERGDPAQVCYKRWIPPMPRSK